MSLVEKLLDAYPAETGMPSKMRARRSTSCTSAPASA
jgi:hypothetical protein